MTCAMCNNQGEIKRFVSPGICIGSVPCPRCRREDFRRVLTDFPLPQDIGWQVGSKTSEPVV